MKTKSLRNLLAGVAMTILFANYANAQLPFPALVGYWETWGSMKLTQINSAYNVIDIAFAVTKGGSMYDMEMASMSPYNSIAAFKADVQTLHQQGKVVILSIGGANDPVFLSDASQKATFVSSMNKIFTDYGDVFDGIDIDLESSSIKQFPSTWTTTSPSPQQQLLIDGIKEIMAAYKSRTGKKLLLTFAPETFYVQGGLGSGQITQPGGGGYLALLEVLKDDIDMLHCQLYNVYSTNVAIDGKEYTEGTGDFIVAMTETVIKGFTVLSNHGKFSGFPARRVGFGLPATTGAAGRGYVAPAEVCKAAQYLRGVITKPAGWNYTLTASYPDLGGMMTWDVNEDQKGSYAFANNFSCAFKVGSGINELATNNITGLYPNPATDKLTIELNNDANRTIRIFNTMGQIVIERNISQQRITIDISPLPQGIYSVNIENSVQKFIKE